MSEKMLVCVTGLLGSGKTELVKGLETFDFESLNIGDELARLYRIEHNLSENCAVPGLERMKTHKKIRQQDPEYFARFIVEGTYARRVIDGLRNLRDAEQLIKAGGHIISLVAPRAVRMSRRLGLDDAKDPSLSAMLERELTELNDSDMNGAQALRVMALSENNGFFVDATQTKEAVLEQVADRLGLI